MAGYFKSAIAGSPGVQEDADAAALCGDELEHHFKEYMISPFTAMMQHKWMLSYDQATVGVTSGFGHLIDHMATSRAVKSATAEVIYLTNQKFGNKPKDTDLPLTDHNA